MRDVLAIVDVERPTGVIVQFGGQTPLKLADDLARLGVPIIGTSPDAIDQAEDRERFQQLVEKLRLLQPSNRVASNAEQGVQRAEEIGVSTYRKAFLRIGWSVPWSWSITKTSCVNTCKAQ